MDHRPDFMTVSMESSSAFAGPFCVGEVKGEDQQKNIHALLVDLMRVAIICKDTIDEKNTVGILGVHICGNFLALSVLYINP
jgi:hypothetical protein